MPDSTSAIDIAKFNLDAYVKVAESQANTMTAFANYNFRMMEVLELRIKVETDILKLRIMQAAFYDYEMARRRALRRVRDLEDKANRVSTSIRQLNHLVLAEATPATWVPFGWRGFWYLISQSPVAAATEMALIKCAARDRKGASFFRASSPNDPISDAPANIVTALVLMDWARKLPALPRMGSSPYGKLATLLSILGTHGNSLHGDAKANLKTAETDLERLRKMNWKNVKIEDEKPKET